MELRNIHEKLEIYIFIALFSILVKWELVDNNWYTIEDTFAQSRNFEEAKQFCESIGDNVFLFEPRSLTTLLAIREKLGYKAKISGFWINVKRGADNK